MEKQIPSILDSKLVLIFEGGVCLSLIYLAVNASFLQDEKEETFWGFSHVLLKTSTMQYGRF